MQLSLLKSKIHRATVTEADLHYEGSIGIDRALMDQVGILPYERVEVYNITNGARFNTYTIVKEAGSGSITINGAAAHISGVDDLVIICSYAAMTPEEAETHVPKVLLVDEENKPKVMKSGARFNG